MASTAAKKKSDIPLVVAALVGVAAYAVATVLVVNAAGGTKPSADYSNTPNAEVSAPPDFK